MTLQARTTIRAVAMLAAALLLSGCVIVPDGHGHYHHHGYYGWR